MKPIYPAFALITAFVALSAPAFADDSILRDNSVDSKFSADNAPHVDTSQVKPGHHKAGIGDGMMGVMHKHKGPPKPAPITAGPQPGPPPLKDVVGKHDNGNK